MSTTLQTVLLLAAVIGGLSGWAAIGAWWYRERTKTVRVTPTKQSDMWYIVLDATFDDKW